MLADYCRVSPHDQTPLRKGTRRRNARCQASLPKAIGAREDRWSRRRRNAEIADIEQLVSLAFDKAKPDVRLQSTNDRREHHSYRESATRS